MNRWTQPNERKKKKKSPQNCGPAKRCVTALILACFIVVSGLPTQASTAGAIESERPTARVTEFATGLLGGDASLVITPSVPSLGIGYAAKDIPGYLGSIDSPNVWICFLGSSSLTPFSATSANDCREGNGYGAPGQAAPQGALLFTNIGGGTGTGHTTPAGLSSVETMATTLKSNGFDGISFDMESLDGFSTYESFAQKMTSAINAAKNAGLLTLLTTAKSGVSSGQLIHSNGGTILTSTTFKTFQQEVVPLFDIYSPQCYDNGGDGQFSTGPAAHICHPFSLSYDGYSQAQRIWPSVSGFWLQSSDAGDGTPTDAIKKLNAASIDGAPLFPKTVTGYIVFHGKA